MDKRIYSRIVNICIALAIISAMLYGRASAAGKGWIVVSVIAVAGLVSVCAYFSATWNESAERPREREPSLEYALTAVPKTEEIVASEYSDMTMPVFVHNYSGMVVRHREMLMQRDSFERLCNLLLSEVAWHAQSEQQLHVGDTIDRITRAEAEMELVVISRAAGGTMFFKIRTARPSSSRAKGRPARQPTTDQVFDWVDLTSSMPA